MKMYDWQIRYGEKRQFELRSGERTYATEEDARRAGDAFLSHLFDREEHYPNATIEVVEVAPK